MRKWLTPDTPSGAGEYEVTRHLTMPRDFVIYANGALAELTKSHNWEPFGTMTPGETAAAWENIYQDYLMTNHDKLHIIRTGGSVSAGSTSTYCAQTVPGEFWEIVQVELYSSLSNVTMSAQVDPLGWGSTKNYNLLPPQQYANGLAVWKGSHFMDVASELCATWTAAGAGASTELVIWYRIINE